MAIGEVENLEVLDENGKGRGIYVSRKDAHALGIPHAHMAVVILDSATGKLLIQKRSDGVEKYPGMYDLLSGHIKKGKSEVDTLIAECQEEAGVDATTYDNLVKIASIPRDDVTNNGTFFEKGTTELYVLEKDLSEYSFDKHDDEVSWLGLMTLEELTTLMEAGNVVPRPDVWETALKYIKEENKESE